MFIYDAEVLPQVRLVGRIRYKEKWSHFPRCIDEYVAYIMVNGTMYIEEDGHRYHIKKHEMLILEPGLEHKGYQGAACEYYYIHFTHKQMYRVADEEADEIVRDMMEKRKKSIQCDNLAEGNVIDSLVVLPKVFSLAQEKGYLAMLKSAVGKYYTRKEQFKRLTSTYVHAIMVEISQDYLSANMLQGSKTHIKRSSITAENVLHYLNVNYAGRIDSAMIEEKFEVNFDYLNRVFTSITGETIFRYLTKIRINHAKELIRTTNLPFGEIGYLVGIEDPFYFSKLFKKVTGFTPTCYYEEIHQGMSEGNM